MQKVAGMTATMMATSQAVVATHEKDSEKRRRSGRLGGVMQAVSSAECEVLGTKDSSYALEDSMYVTSAVVCCVHVACVLHAWCMQVGCLLARGV